MEKKHHGFTFHFVLTFWHACTFKNIRFFMTTTSSLVFTTTPHTPHYHHRCRISRVWQTSKGRLWSLERLASREHHGGPRNRDPSQHRTAQQRQWAHGAWRLQMTLFVFSSVLLTPLLAWYWWMVVALLYAWSCYDLSARFVFIFTVM